MAEIEFGIPTVQFGYLHIKASPEELGLSGFDPYEVGKAYAVWCNLATQGRFAGEKLDLKYEEADPPGGTINSDTDEAELAAAQKMIEEHLGSTSPVPWESEAPAPKAEPWKTGPKTKPAKIDW